MNLGDIAFGIDKEGCGHKLGYLVTSGDRFVFVEEDGEGEGVIKIGGEVVIDGGRRFGAINSQDD